MAINLWSAQFRRLTRATAAFFFGMVSLGTPSGGRDAIAQPPREEEREKIGNIHFQKGRELAEQDDIRGAYREFLEAWKLHPRYDIAGNLGLMELKLGKARDAAVHLAYCEQTFPVPDTDELRQKLEAVRQVSKEARARVAGARVRVIADDGRRVVGASVAVDGGAVGEVRAGDEVAQLSGRRGEVFVDPGSRRFSASLPGCKDAIVTRAVQKGESANVTLVLACSKEISVPLLITGIGVAAAGIATGIGTTVHAASRDRDADAAWVELYDATGRDACTLPINQAKCDELNDAHRSWQTFRGAAVASFSIGGAAAVVTTLYALSRGSSSKPDEPPGVQVGFSAGPAGGGALVHGVF